MSWSDRRRFAGATIFVKRLQLLTESQKFPLVGGAQVPKAT
jgi:hypothetical protein